MDVLVSNLFVDKHLGSSREDLLHHFTINIRQSIIAPKMT